MPHDSPRVSGPPVLRTYEHVPDPAMERALRLADAQSYDAIRDWVEASAKANRGAEGSSEDQSNERLQILADLERKVEAATASWTRGLRQVDPRVALDMERLTAIALRPENQFLADGGLNRYAWSIGAAGGGHDSSDAAVEACLEPASRMFCLDYMWRTLAALGDEQQYSFGQHESFERIRRAASTEIRFSWVSELCVSTALEAAKNSPHDYAALCWIEQGDIEALFAALRAVARTGDVGLLGDAAKGARRLAKAMSIPAGAIPNSSLNPVVQSVEMERFPFIDFGELVAPLAVREAVLALETSFFEYVGRACGQSARGPLYEQALARSLATVAPRGVDVPIGNSIDVQDDGTLHEVDFAVLSSSLTVVGEAKAYFVTTTSESVVNAFPQQAGKATKQLARRIRALRDGATLIVDGVTLRPPAGDVAGWGAPLHNYGGMTASSKSLATLDEDTTDIHLIPWHQSVLVLQSMMNGTDLRRYLTLREAVLKADVPIADEIDLLTQYLRGDPAQIEGMLGEPALDAVRFLMPHALHPGYGISLTRPPSEHRRNWREFIRTKLEPLGRPDQGRA